jgi:hypothetical protein
VPEDLDLHFVFHCGYSLQEGCRSVNNFRTVFSGNKFRANRLRNRTWHAPCWGARAVPTPRWLA